MGGAGDRRCFRTAGQVYFGEVQESEAGQCWRHGVGLQIITAATVRGDAIKWGEYDGSWKNGTMTGAGSYRWSDGSHYVGSFRDGRMHGHGKFTWIEGSSYDGAWVAGEMTGQGTFYSAYSGVTSQGLFHRNCWRQHDGRWVNVMKKREEGRVAKLQIGAIPRPHAQMPVLRCTPETLFETLANLPDLLAQRRAPTDLVPLILADETCPRGEGAKDLSPLWCLEAGQQGCREETTVHLAYAAAEKRRNRDFLKIFRDAIGKALLTYRPFTLVFGDDKDESGQMPKAWGLKEFLEPSSLPLDLFDLRNFHGTGGVDAFLPPDKVTAAQKPAMPPQPSSLGHAAAAGSEGSVPGSRTGSKQSQSDPVCAAPDAPPPTAYILQFLLVSLSRIQACHLLRTDKEKGSFHYDADYKEEVRAQLGERFAQHVPLHRVAAIVVTNGDADA
eukprot:TRINITY_DN26438_c0_g1_i1.p1 TRINITY_DN26438_c0_g1~~TRINITY_DN26438_c0_g1_i1.p1  ORF type:complete len:443 (+),score=86.81 TRINITY_DN26438_c0_g1_i1:100-1428(+)